ncbi:MAG: sulfatase-like hydrolase/transferase [Alphaproteobacteria bacterium]|nr:sulfatase-like hydrolase/transferase [Alphaproteobacteria bacterium]
MARPNIILLIVDTLREDRLGISGYRPGLTPNLDRLAGNSLRATGHFANGCVTQVAFPAMFTSTLPFDYGGYNDGIRHRPVAFPEVLREAGYETWGVVTGHPCSSHFGYDRGFDHFVDLIDLYQWFRSIFKTMLRELFDRWQSGELTDAEMFAWLSETYDSCLADTIHFIERLDRLGMPESGRNRTRLLGEVKAERDLLRQDPRAICDKLIALDQDYQFALGVAVPPPALLRRIRRRNRIRDRLNRRIMLLSDRRAFRAETVNDLFAQYLAGRESGQPFFALLHYFDLHEAKLLLSNWTSRKALRFPAAAGRALSGRAPGQGGIFYDVTLAMVDEQVGRLLRLLDLHDLARDTVLVVTGDHGIEAGAPARPFKSDMSRAFYDEFIHVPFFAHGSGIAPEEIDGLASHLDLAPTILEIAGSAVPESFQGASLFRRRTNHPAFVVSENAGNGRCDMAEKTLFFGLRSERCKTVFEAQDFIVAEREVYDLVQDPFEQTNLVGTEAFPAERAAHLAFVQARVNGLKEALLHGHHALRSGVTR